MRSRSLFRRAETLRVLVFWAAALFALVMACLPQAPPMFEAAGDKFQHIVAFLVLTGLALWSYPQVALARIAIGLSAYGALIEILQAIPALHRDSDIRDWLADTVAVICVCVVAAIVRRNAVRSPSPRQ